MLKLLQQQLLTCNHTLIGLSFFSPAIPPEVERLIDQWNINKACRSVNAPTKFIKYGKSIIAQILCALYNKCIVEGEYTDLFKILEVIPIFK